MNAISALAIEYARRAVYKRYKREMTDARCELEAAMAAHAMVHGNGIIERFKELIEFIGL